MRWIIRTVLSLLSWAFSLGITVGILGLLLSAAVYYSYNKDLPDYRELAQYDPPTVTRLYAADGKLMAEYATEKRIFVPLSAIPKQVIHAFLSAEDKNFYSHTGVDVTGILRALRDNVVNYGQRKSLVGGSTITQQVVKNFLLSSEKSLERKVKEAILAVRITQAFSKDRILELYLNEIYLGLGSYGVAAAAQNYFGKSLEELTVDEAALLATQPKAPNLYNPKRNHQAALERRNWVINRMQEDGHITATQAIEATRAPLALRSRDIADVVNAGFFSEEVRRRLAEMYGSQVLYEGGLVVKTTLNPKYQELADRALQEALIAHDRRHPHYRGPLGTLALNEKTPEALTEFYKQHASQILPSQLLAVVKSVDAKQAKILYTDGKESAIASAGIAWTGKKKPGDLLKPGDVVLVAPYNTASAELQQIPAANGAMVVADPHTGRILAMSGGYRYGSTEFNRATQAKRQPGSAFKPFVYMAALEAGLTPASRVLDAPIELSQGAGQPTWRPENYEENYLGDTTLRVGLEKSRNTMTVRIAQMIGLDRCLEMGKRLGIYDKPPRNLSIVLGTSETTLVNLVNAYGMIANGGRQIFPSLIERIDDRHGKAIFRRDGRVCEQCTIEISETMPPNVVPPDLPDTREQIIDPRIAYQMTSLLQGVVQRGTATRAQSIGKTVAGKTGTTNESFDTWFVGFSPDLVVGVYIGYDQPHSLGAKETGGSTALPAFISFMKEALKDTPDQPFGIPHGVRFARTELKTGFEAEEQPVDEFGAPIPVGPTINEAFITGGPVYIPGQTSKNALDALQNFKGDFEPKAPPLPWLTPPPAQPPAPSAPASPRPPTDLFKPVPEQMRPDDAETGQESF